MGDVEFIHRVDWTGGAKTKRLEQQKMNVHYSFLERLGILTQTTARGAGVGYLTTPPSLHVTQNCVLVRNCVLFFSLWDTSAWIHLPMKIRAVLVWCSSPRRSTKHKVMLVLWDMESRIALLITKRTNRIILTHTHIRAHSLTEHAQKVWNDFRSHRTRPGIARQRGHQQRCPRKIFNHNITEAQTRPICTSTSKTRMDAFDERMPGACMHACFQNSEYFACCCMRSFHVETCSLGKRARCTTTISRARTPSISSTYLCQETRKYIAKNKYNKHTRQVDRCVICILAHITHSARVKVDHEPERSFQHILVDYPPFLDRSRGKKTNRILLPRTKS
jgi:hypothetical protein